jgi:hypothetical protein
MEYQSEAMQEPVSYKHTVDSKVTAECRAVSKLLLYRESLRSAICVS